MKTAAMLLLKGFYKDRKMVDVLNRAKQSKKEMAKEALKNWKANSTSGNTLLSSEEQVDSSKNHKAAPQTKQVDLKNFMERNNYFILNLNNE